MTKTFQFKQFSMMTGDAGMPITTDGVLLGAWANIHQAKTILDIGTGTGLLALMCAQRRPNAHIVAIDIDPTAVKIATDNVQQSPWKSNIQIRQGDITEEKINQAFDPIKRLGCINSFDHIICNPPYFESGETSANILRAQARHAITLPYQALIDSCCRLLNPQGCASFILPYQESLHFIDLAQASKLKLQQYCEVKTTPNKPVSRCLLSFSYQAIEPKNTQLTIYNSSSQYSDEFIRLTRDFYLKMP